MDDVDVADQAYNVHLEACLRSNVCLSSLQQVFLFNKASEPKAGGWVTPERGEQQRMVAISRWLSVMGFNPWSRRPGRWSVLTGTLGSRITSCPCAM